TRKEGKLGGFTLGIGVIFIYYGIMQMAEALTKGGRLDAAWSRWVPNIVVGLLAIAAMWIRTHRAGREIAIRLPGWLRLPRRGTPATGRVRTNAAGQVVLVIRVPELSLP